MNTFNLNATIIISIICKKPKINLFNISLAGLFSKDDVTELGPIMDGTADVRRNSDDTVIYDLTGGNVHDLFLATWAYEWAKARGLGSTFAFTGEDLPRDR